MSMIPRFVRSLNRSVRTPLHAAPLRSLHNPMFPTAAPTNPDTQTSNKKDEEEDDSFLSRYGGRIALAAFGFAAYLITRWVKSNTNKSNTATLINSKSAIDSYESYELRHAANIEASAITSLISQLPSSPTYGEVLKLLQSVASSSQATVRTPFPYSYYLDRIVLATVKQDYCTEEETASKPTLDLASITLSFPFAATLFTLVENGPIRDRIHSLYDIAATGNANKSLSYGDLISYVQILVDTCQIPADKRVAVADSWPMVTHREKNAQEIVDHLYVEKKYKKEDAITKEKFEEMLLSTYICIWGECYRRNN